MTLPASPYSFSPGTTIYSAQVNANFTQINADAAAGGANADITSLAGTGAGVAVAGTNTNGNAAAGNIGEYITADVASPGSSVSSTVSANITSISLTAGDWDVEGIVLLVPSSTVSQVKGWVSTTTAKASPVETDGLMCLGTAGSAIQCGGPTGAVRISLAATTTVYLSINATFASTATAFGFIRARRVR